MRCDLAGRSLCVLVCGVLPVMAQTRDLPTDSGHASGEASGDAPGDAPGNGSTEPDVEPEPVVEVAVSVSVSGQGRETENNVAVSASLTGPGACGHGPGPAAAAAALGSASCTASTSGYSARLEMHVRLRGDRLGCKSTVAGHGLATSVDASSDDAPAAAADPSRGNVSQQERGPVGHSAAAGSGSGPGLTSKMHPKLDREGCWVWGTPNDHAPASCLGSASKPGPQGGRGADHAKANRDRAADSVEVYCTRSNWAARAGKYHKDFHCTWFHGQRTSIPVCVTEAEALHNNMTRCSVCWS